MCGRYVPPNEAAIERYWRIDRRNWRGFIKPAFNVAPTTQVPILEYALHALPDACAGLVRVERQGGGAQ